MNGHTHFVPVQTCSKCKQDVPRKDGRAFPLICPWCKRILLPMSENELSVPDKPQSGELTLDPFDKKFLKAMRIAVS